MFSNGVMFSKGVRGQLSELDTKYKWQQAHLLDIHIPAAVSTGGGLTLQLFTSTASWQHQSNFKHPDMTALKELSHMLKCNSHPQSNTCDCVSQCSACRVLLLHM